MNNLKEYIQEKLIVNNTISNYFYYPETTRELIECIKEKIEKEGLGTEQNLLDLNDIDTSKITDMSYLFNGINSPLVNLSKTGYFDISGWNVSNVKDMNTMFYNSDFNGDISDWDVSNVKDMSFMFAKSRFDGKNSNISGWDVSNVENMQFMFSDTKFGGNLSKWNVSNVKDMCRMFKDSKFSGNIDKWKVKENTDMRYMFDNCPLKKNPPKWYKE